MIVSLADLNSLYGKELAKACLLFSHPVFAIGSVA